MAWWYAPLAMGAGQVLMNEFVTKPQQQKQNQTNANLAAAQTEFSPWTGASVGQYQHREPESSASKGLQGFGQGMAFQQAYNKSLQGSQSNPLSMADQEKVNRTVNQAMSNADTTAYNYNPQMSMWNSNQVVG